MLSFATANLLIFGFAKSGFDVTKSGISMYNGRESTNQRIELTWKVRNFQANNIELFGKPA